MVESKNGVYIAWRVFEDYATKGSLILKEMVHFALDRLLGDAKTFHSNLPSQGTATVTYQKDQDRYIHHLLYAAPVKRGNGVEVIEDIVPLYDINVAVNVPSKNISKVYLVPQMEELTFETKGDLLLYTVPKLECHQMIVLE